MSETLRMVLLVVTVLCAMVSIAMVPLAVSAARRARAATGRAEAAKQQAMRNLAVATWQRRERFERGEFALPGRTMCPECTAFVELPGSDAGVHECDPVLLEAAQMPLVR